MYVTWDICSKTPQNEQDLLYHKERVHEYGEFCELYPCDECGIQCDEVHDLKTHKENSHRQTTINDDDSTKKSSDLSLKITNKLLTRKRKFGANKNSFIDDDYNPADYEKL